MSGSSEKLEVWLDWELGPPLEPSLVKSATLLMQDGDNSSHILISNKVNGVRESAH